METDRRRTTMRRVDYARYGPPEVLTIVEAPRPSIRPRTVLVRVAASSLNAIDWKNRQGRFRAVTGLWRPRTRQGFDVAGTVLAVGAGVVGFRTGDRVFGLLGNFTGGAFADEVLMRPGQLELVPRGLGFTEVAGLPMAATTAWQALFELGRLRPGQRLLVNGGSSGVGHFAIQLARAHGAYVTAVCSDRNADFCKALGADEVVDYAIRDFARDRDRFDVVFDVVNNRSLVQVRSALRRHGTYVGTTPTPRLLWSILTTSQAKFVAVSPRSDALAAIRALVEQGLVRTHVERVYPLEEIVAAHRDAERQRTRGKLVILLDERP